MMLGVIVYQILELLIQLYYVISVVAFPPTSSAAPGSGMAPARKPRFFARCPYSGMTKVLANPSKTPKFLVSVQTWLQRWSGEST